MCFVSVRPAKFTRVEPGTLERVVTHAQMLHASFSSVALALFPSQTGGLYEAAQSV